jgi:hypothetical protein
MSFTRRLAYFIRHDFTDCPCFKELNGMTRKFSILLLEYLDKIKLAILVGDTRILCEKISWKGYWDGVFWISTMIFPCAGFFP